MRRLLVGIVLALPFPACPAQAAMQPPVQASPVQVPPVQTPPVQTPLPETAQPMQPPAGPVFVIYPATPPQHTTILLNTTTGETWLLGVNGPDGQYQWTRIAVGDPSETAAAPR